MKLLAAVLALGLSGSAFADGTSQAGRPEVLKARLEVFKKLSKEQKQKLRERVELLKKLPQVERRRLQDNLKKFARLSEKERQVVREKVQKLAPEDRKAFVEVASGFFQWANRQGIVEGFPRDVFFQWVRDQRADDLAVLRDLDPEDRLEGFLALYNDFKAASLQRIRDHVKRHKCSTEEQVREVADAGPREFWTSVRSVWERCNPELKKKRETFRSNGGPVAPRRQ